MTAREIIVDSFAGGGGASTGIEMALGRSPDIAINHDDMALAMHAANHPDTLHLPHNVWKVDPLDVCGRRPVGLLWASPDCKHFSKAKGGKPVKRNIRDLAWVVVRWARQVRPRVIILENVEEFQDWGPVGADQRPCPERRGETFRRWIGDLKRLGYRVAWRELRACDYGAPTIRKRLFLIARRDGRPIVWPEPTHGDPNSEAVQSGKLKPWRTAAEILDWSLPCPSIFLTREEGRAEGVNRPLAPATMARIAKGVQRYVIDAAEPFIVSLTHHGGERVEPVGEPVKTVTAAHRGEKAIITPILVGCGGRAGQSRPRSANEPTHTGTAKADTCLAVPYLVPRYGERPGQEPRTRSIEEPMPVVVPTANGGTLAAVHLARQFGTAIGSSVDSPTCTVMTDGGGGKSHLVATYLAQHNTDMVGHDARKPVSTIVGKGCTQAVVGASLIPYYGSETDGVGTGEPMRTVTTRDRFGFAAVDGAVPPLTDAMRARALQVADFLHAHGVAVEGEYATAGEFVIVDIGMRMLTPRELFRAQGFPESYEIETGLRVTGAFDDGHVEVPLTKTAQVRMCGNSVCPPIAAALVGANFVPDETLEMRHRARPADEALALFAAE